MLTLTDIPFPSATIIRSGSGADRALDRGAAGTARPVCCRPRCQRRCGRAARDVALRWCRCRDRCARGQRMRWRGSDGGRGRGTYGGGLMPGAASVPVSAGEGVAAIVVTHESRSEEHTSELQSLMRISYAVFCLKKKKKEITQPKSLPYCETSQT